MARQNPITLAEKRKIRTMRNVRRHLRVGRQQFASLVGVGECTLVARENFRSPWPGNPLRDHRRKIEAELARMERDIATVRALLSEAATPAEAAASAPTPSPMSATPHPTEAATA